MKKFLYTLLTGTVVYFVLAFYLYNIKFKKVILENLGSAINAVKDPVETGYVLASNISICLMLALFFTYHLNPKTLLNGLKNGALIGFFVSCFMDLSYYGTTNLMNLHATIIDIFILTLITAVSGAAMGFVLSKLK